MTNIDPMKVNAYGVSTDQGLMVRLMMLNSVTYQTTKLISVTTKATLHSHKTELNTVCSCGRLTAIVSVISYRRTKQMLNKYINILAYNL